jgi:filamentous hemagglutinin family protein
MNRSFSLIWNDRRAAYVPAPESARRSGKGCGVRALGAVVLCAVSIGAHALPAGGQVSAGQGSIAQSGRAMTVTQQSQSLAINWRAFGIGANESVGFAQPNASAIALNRVLGADPTQIYGQLSANGQVWILNPNGVLFGGGAQVNVGGLVAATLNISDADFIAGRRAFSGNGGSVTNMGSISAAEGGYVALLGGKVSNEGVIQARLGTVALGAGNQITLDFAGDKLLNLQVDQGAVNALAQNKQLIQADGGTVLLSARAANTLLGTVVNNAGIVEARTIDSHNGTIKLLGSMEGGTVQVGGTLDASAPNGGDGGFIETSGAHVSTAADARVTTAALTGKTGQWLIDPNNFMIVPGRGGDITGAALGNQLNSTNVTILSSSGKGGGSGDVMVNDNVVWNSASSLTLSAYHDVKVVKAISNRGNGGVTLRADNTGNCVSGSKNCGTISFTPHAGITVNGGAVNLYYNPAGSNKAADANGNGPSYASPTDYSGHVTLNGGSTLNAWMLVNDVNQLQAMNTNLVGNYALGRDIDATVTAGWNGAAGFVPVGVAYAPFFSGQFDGLGHTITGLTINRPSSEYVGLFGQNNGQVRNVGMVADAFSGTYAVGGLVGLNHGTVSNSYSTGAVSGVTGVGGLPLPQYAGGLVGYNYGTVSNSHSTGAVNGTYYVGGLAGYNTGTVSNSHSTGIVIGYNSVGGLVGYNTGTVSNSYSAGTVDGSYGVGGLAGDNLGTVSNSSSTGAINGYAEVGGLVGGNSGTVSNSSSTGTVNGQFDVGGLVGSSQSFGTVSNSSSAGAVNGTRYAGGLVGYNYGTVSNSHSTGNVDGTTAAGGLVGINSGTVSNSYSTGAVDGYFGTGGLVAANTGTVSNSYSTGAVSGLYYVGGLVGSNSGGTVSNSYWDTTTSGQSTSAGGTGLTDVQMKQKASFTGFDFVNIWGIDEGVSYPFLLAH